MMQCHDSYADAGASTGPAPGPVPPVDGAQCHDPVALEARVGVAAGTGADAPGAEVSVLVADSDPQTRDEIRRLLRADVRFGRITEVTAGDEAVRLAEKVDVVVVDLRSVRGLGSLGTINQIAGRSGHPAIVGLNETGVEWLSLAARCEGADDVVDWPDDGVGLAERLLQAARP
jgi:CheY-like chemotaxis protein